MRALSEPVERVLDRVRLFLGMPEIRAMHVRTSPQLAPVIVGVIAACEHKAHSVSPMLMLVTPAGGEGRGWDARTRELLREVDDLREAAREADVEVGPVSTPERAGLAGFGVTLANVTRAVSAPLSGVTLILVPGPNARGLDEDLAALLAQSSLREARWIVVEPGADTRAPIAALGERAFLVDAMPSESDLAAELLERARNASAAPPGASGPTAAGAAGPGVLPPRRPHEGPETPPEVLEAVLQKNGVAPAHARPELNHRVRTAVLHATAAMAAKNLPHALRHFGDAKQACLEAGLIREAVVYEITAASIALSSAPEAASGAFQSARVRATEIGASDLAARAELGRAGALLALRRVREASDAYRSAGEMAESTPVLAIEAYRMSGQLLAAERRLEEAATVWRRALALAESTTAVERMGSTAPEIARTLAALCEKHGLTAQAASLREQANRLDAPPALEALHPAGEAAAMRS